MARFEFQAEYAILLILNVNRTFKHESKELIDRKRWFAALDWMREKGTVPTGYGISTKNV